MKFTDEELSRIMSAHAVGLLVRSGRGSFNLHVDAVCVPKGIGCINQFAFNESGPSAAAILNDRAAMWFDTYYKPDWTVDEFLRELERQGLA